MTAEERKVFIRECAMRLAAAYIQSDVQKVTWENVACGANALADELDRYEKKREG